jgi:catechol 2,3-dioxygenase-like lactoylglutathione lyase family enzyme
MIDHIKLFVSDVGRSRRFYEHALAPLGYRVILEPSPEVVGMGAGMPDFWLAPAGGEPRPTGHVAFRAAAEEVVRAFHRAGLEAGGRDNGPPGPRPQYHPRYFGAFVLDPDGNNVEAVSHESDESPQGATRSGVRPQA